VLWFGLVGLPDRADARTWHVPAEAPTIQAGIDSAVAGDVVEVACGTYLEDNIKMKRGIVLRSATGQPDCVTIDALQRDRVIDCKFVPGGAAEIEGFTLTNGWALGQHLNGGGIRCYNASVQIRRCHFVGNEADFGGGLFCAGYQSYTEVTVTECLFLGNRATWETTNGGFGGGVFAGINATVHLVACRLQENQATNGGGLFWLNPFHPPDLTHCTVVGNQASQAGGGICLRGSGEVTVFNTDIHQNSAQTGADGFVRDTCSLLLTCCAVDLAAWAGEGEITLDNADCPVSQESRSWGAVKALYQ